MSKIKKSTKKTSDELEDIQDNSSGYIATNFEKLRDVIVKNIPLEFKPLIPESLDIEIEDLPKTLHLEIPFIDTRKNIYYIDQIDILIESNVGKTGKLSKIKPLKVKCN